LEKKVSTEAFETLGLRNMPQLVLAPRKFTEREWISVHLVKFYNEISLLWNYIHSSCTAEQCPRMTCDWKTTYLWPLESVNESVPVNAGKYIDLVFEMMEENINNSMLFPLPLISYPCTPTTATIPMIPMIPKDEKEELMLVRKDDTMTKENNDDKSDNEDDDNDTDNDDDNNNNKLNHSTSNPNHGYSHSRSNESEHTKPKSLHGINEIDVLSKTHIKSHSTMADEKEFRFIAQVMFRRLYRVFGHIYYAHYRTIKKSFLHKHFNTSFKHFLFFCNQFQFKLESTSGIMRDVTDALMSDLYRKIR